MACSKVFSALAPQAVIPGIEGDALICASRTGSSTNAIRQRFGFLVR
jgi:hypothetical protein